MRDKITTMISKGTNSQTFNKTIELDGATPWGHYKMASSGRVMSINLALDEW